MTLWFVFALMTAAAIFAVLWPLGRARPAAKRRQRGDRLQGSTCRDRSRPRRGPDRLLRSRGRAGRNQPPSAGRGGQPARSADRIEHQVAPLRGGPGAGGAAGRVAGFLPPARLAAARRFSAGRTHPRARSPPSRSTIWWRRSRRIWRKIRPMAAAGTCWRRCWRGSAAMTKRCGPIAIRSPIMATAPSAGPISAKPSPAAAGGVVTAEAKAEFERAIALERGRGQGELLPRPCRRTGRPHAPRPPRSGARCSQRRRRMRRGVRWFRPHWPGSAVPPLRRCRMMRWPRQRT